MRQLIPSAIPFLDRLPVQSQSVLLSQAVCPWHRSADNGSLGTALKLITWADSKAKIYSVFHSKLISPPGGVLAPLPLQSLCSDGELLGGMADGGGVSMHELDHWVERMSSCQFPGKSAILWCLSNCFFSTFQHMHFLCTEV